MWATAIILRFQLDSIYYTFNIPPAYVTHLIITFDNVFLG